MPAAVIFDFDGVLVDSEPLHYRAFLEVLAPFDISCSWDDYLARYMGYDDRDALRTFFATRGETLSPQRLKELIGQKAEVFRSIVGQGVTAYPGVVELVGSLAAQLPVGLCSGALRGDIDPILSQLNLTDAFRIIVSADDVSVSKPDPASYRLAFQRLVETVPGQTLAVSATLAIEDTPAGIASARKAGLTVMAVANSYPSAKLEHDGCTVVETLQGMTLESLQRLC
ncbi:MAG TPA: HAD family phosphatase [Desulfuromonadales bacterium]|nr:HAD family phosphatase [Desulfuromonadales bacterium]